MPASDRSAQGNERVRRCRSLNVAGRNGEYVFHAIDVPEEAAIDLGALFAPVIRVNDAPARRFDPHAKQPYAREVFGDGERGFFFGRAAFGCGDCGHFTRRSFPPSPVVPAFSPVIPAKAGIQRVGDAVQASPPPLDFGFRQPRALMSTRPSAGGTRASAAVRAGRPRSQTAKPNPCKPFM